MDEKELRKAYDEEWKQKEPTKYICWLITYIGSFIPIVIALLTIVGGINSRTIPKLITCIVVYLVLEIIAAVLMSEHKRGWKDYLEKHKK